MTKLKVLFWILFFASAVAFFTPLQVQENTGLGLDKWFHVILFACLAIFGLRSYPKKKILLIAFLATYTLVTELIQKYFIPHRSFDIYDIFSDCAGIAFGILITKLNIYARGN